MVLIKACREKRGSIFREVELTSKMELLMLQASDCGLHDTVNTLTSETPSHETHLNSQYCENSNSHEAP